MTILAAALILVGMFFLLVAAIGMVRFPDVFTRSHAVSLTDSLGAFCMLAGLSLYHGFGTNMLRILVVLFLLFLLNPVIAHATIRAAYRAGLKPQATEEEE
jgi:multicomponent Na+:H+ antiporter subunit G